jgi:hypothetical protein
VDVGRLPIDEQMAAFQAALSRNGTLAEVLAQAAAMDLPGRYMVVGCLYQTVWNVVTGQPPEAGILDYDHSWACSLSSSSPGTSSRRRSSDGPAPPHCPPGTSR